MSEEASRSKLRQARQARHWTQEYVAEQVGASPLSVLRWEAGRTYPTPFYRQQLKTVFESSLEELGLAQSDPGQMQDAPPIQRDISTVPLPPLHEELIGRATLLQQLQTVLCQQPTSIALVGLPGVGKTSLANALVYDPMIAAAYPDGTLWAGLGSAPDLMNVLTRWAMAIGMLPSAIDKLHDAESMAQAIHRHIGQRRLLLVLDDAWQIEHALLCQVGGPQCAHILTTRSPRVGEEFAPHATFAIEELGVDDGLRLLQRLAPKTTQMFPQRMQSLVQATGGLPLALALIGHALYVHEKTGRSQRLLAVIERLEHDAGYLHLAQPLASARYSTMPSRTISLAHVIAISVQSLPPTAQTLLQIVAMFPTKPQTFAEAWAQTIAGWEKDAFLEALDILLDAGLVMLGQSERYTMHQAIADYARLQMPDQAQRMWHNRFLACALAFAERHSQEHDQLAREEHQLFFALALAQRRQHVELEIQLSLALRQYAIEFGRGHVLLQHLEPLYQQKRIPDAYTIPVALCLAQAYRRRGRYTEAKELATVGLQQARAEAQLAQVSEFLAMLGFIDGYQAQFTTAQQFLEESLAIAQTLGLRTHMYPALNALGGMAINQGRNAEAERIFHDVLAMAREDHDGVVVSAALESLGALAGYRGDLQRATEYLQEAVTLARQQDHRYRLYSALINLGVIKRSRGHYNEAEADLFEALEFAEEFQDQYRMSNILISLAEVALGRHNSMQAQEYLQLALPITRAIGAAQLQCTALHHLGECFLREKQLATAHTYLTEALTMARDIGHSWILGLCLVAWGSLWLEEQQWEEAQAAYEEALQIALAIESSDLEGMVRFGFAKLAMSQGDREAVQQQTQLSIHLLRKIGHELTPTVEEWYASVQQSPI